MVNFAVLTVLLMLGLPDAVCLAGGILVSLVSNFLLNRRFTFDYARGGNVWMQFIGFAGASSVGMVVNYAVAVFLSHGVLNGVPFGLYLSALAGISVGLVFNFLGNRYLVFRRRYIHK